MKCLLKSFAHLKNWIVCFLIIELWVLCIYMLWVQVLFWKYMVAKILLPVCDMSFHYLDSEDKFWFWWCSILPIYSFMDHALDVLSRKFCLTQGHKGFFPMFSPRSFKYLGFTFMFMVHFEVMNMGVGWSSFLRFWICNHFSNIFWKDHLSSTEKDAFASLSKPFVHTSVHLLLAFYSVLLIAFSVFIPVS